ncbi:MAG: site-specific integrase [Candidatus Omnitrophota bacterium]
MKLTKSVVDKASFAHSMSEEKKQCIFWDDELKGFGLRVFPSGVKTFVVGYRLRGRYRLTSIGRYGVFTVETARKAAQEILFNAAKGIDAAEEKAAARRGDTMADLCAEFFEQHSKIHKRSWKDDKRQIEKIILPTLGKKRIDAVTRHHVSTLHKQYGERAPYQANRVLSLLSKIFEWARLMGYTKSGFENPARGIKKFREEKRDRWITPDELPRLAEAINEEKNIYAKTAFWLLLLTGLRLNELLSARWADIDLSREEWRIPQTKAGRIHHVPLSAAALDILKSIPKCSRNPFVFVGVKEGAHLVNIDKAWRRIKARAGLHDVRIHDLRRTCGSWMASSGVSLPIIGKALNHSNQSTTAVYARLGENPVKGAFEDYGGKILNIAAIRKAKKETA